MNNNTYLGFVKQHLKSIIQIIFQSIVMTEYDDDDIELEETFDDLKWTVTRAAGSLLSEVAELEGNVIWEEVIGFATGKLSSNGWEDQYVGMTCLGAVLNGPD